MDSVYEEYDLNEKVKYFISYYIYQINLYNQGSKNFNIFNLHCLLKNILEELSQNDRERNLKFFQEKLRVILKKDNIVKRNYEYKVNEIINNITSNKKYALIMANNLWNNIKDGKYAKKICSRLEKILFNKKKLEDIKVELNYLIETIIVEFIIYGYSSKEIEKNLYNIFDKYIIQGEFIITNYPIEKKIQNKDEIKEFIDNLSVNDRIKSLKTYFEQTNKKYYYLFNINGIAGLQLDIKLNNVYIYNWKTSYKFDIEVDKKKQEKFPTYEYGDFNKNEIHCCVYIESINKETSWDEITKQLDDALDILYIYHNIGCKIEVDYSHYIVFDENKNIISGGMTREFDAEFKRSVRPLNYDNNTTNTYLKQYQNYSKYILNNESNSSKIIKNSIRYFRKARQIDSLEDKLLNYWICIENIFKINIELPNSVLDIKERDSKYNKISSILPYLIFQNELINEYWICYDYFFKEYINKRISLSKKNISKLQFDLNVKKINLVKFIKNFELMFDENLSELNKNIYRKYLDRLINKDTLKSWINEYINNVKENILILYRYRNMIVHNAQYKNIFMEFYIKSIDKLTINLLSVILNEFYKNKGKTTLESIIINKYIDQKQIIKDFEEKNLKDWFDV